LASLTKGVVNWRSISNDQVAITSARYAAVVSTVAIILSGGSLIYTKRSYDLSAAKEERELKDKEPAIDIQIRPLGASAASLVISIINRADINIAPQGLTVEHSLEAGELYLSSAQQSLDNLRSSLSLQTMGTIAPKGTGTLKATLAGATDGKSDSLTPGIELEFNVLIRFADQQDTIVPIPVVRRILPPLAERPRPTQEMLISAVMEAKKAQRDHRIYLYAQIILGLAASLSLAFYLFRLWRTKADKGAS
jgi:hypothetical protein